MSARGDGLDASLVLLARALDGETSALRRVTKMPVSAVLSHRIAPALALRSAVLSTEHKDLLENPAVEIWRDELRRTAGRQMLLELSLGKVSRALGAVGIRWMPFKGCDLASRLYERSEERPYGDLDILIAEVDLPSAREALEAAGWRPLRDSPASHDYLDREGYAWQALDESGVLLEVHFRLWGWMPSGVIEKFLEGAAPLPEFGATAYQMNWSDAFVLTVIHAWLDAPPRALGRFWELERLTHRVDEERVVAVCEELGAALPMVLAVEAVGRLWPENVVCRRLGERLRPKLRWPELWVHRASRRNPLVVSFSRLALARLLARRPSRSSWRGLWRKIWPHAALVEQGTPPTWTWPRRRLGFFWRTLVQIGGRRRAAVRTVEDSTTLDTSKDLK